MQPNQRLKVLALSGIADSESFHQMIVDNNLNIVKKLSFSDHHKYCQADIDNIKNQKKDTRFDIVITTEKDMIKIEKLKTAGIKMYSLVGDFNIVDEEKNGFYEQLENKLFNRS